MKAWRVNLSLAVVMLILITLYLLQTNCLKSSRETAQDAMQLVGCQLLSTGDKQAVYFFQMFSAGEFTLHRNLWSTIRACNCPEVTVRLQGCKCGPQPAELMQLTAASSWNQRRQPETFTNCANNTSWFTHRMNRGWDHLQPNRNSKSLFCKSIL